MKEIIIDIGNSNVVCYDTINMCHATDNQIIKLNNSIDGLDNIEILCRLWEFNRNEKLVYRYIINKLFDNIIPNKSDLVKECSIATGKNIITYHRALDDLKNRHILFISNNGNIDLADKYNLFKYLDNDRNKEHIKYITIKV